MSDNESNNNSENDRDEKDQKKGNDKDSNKQKDKEVNKNKTEEKNAGNIIPKFDNSKLSESAEIKIDISSPVTSINNKPMVSAIPSKSLNTLALLQEINSDIDSLDKLLNINSHLIPISPIPIHNPPFSHKSTQVYDDIKPLIKTNKSVQISDKDEYFSFKPQATSISNYSYNPNLFSSSSTIKKGEELHKSEYSNRVNDSVVSYPSMRVKKMEDLLNQKHKSRPVIYNQEDNYNNKNLNYYDLQSNIKLRHRKNDANQIEEINNRYNNSINQDLNSSRKLKLNNTLKKSKAKEY